MKTVKFWTLGCKVNQYETQSIRERFLESGFQEINNDQRADIYVINTCTVTQRADSESFNLMRRARRENPKAKLVVTGCLTEMDEDKIRKLKSRSIIVRNKDKTNILKFLSCQNEPNEQNGLNEHNEIGITYFKGHTRAFLKIQDGCDNFCSYCKVPLVRGRSRSRPLNEIVEEAKRLTENGYKEIVLTGVCLGAYGRDLPSQINLVDVIESIEKINGILRIRLSSIEAGDINDELINKMVNSQKLCPHLHIPIQSGDNEILGRMDRGYTHESYLNLIRRIKKFIPEIAITTDIMVGFPGETAKNFQNSVKLVKEIQPLRAHIFPYSRREGTIAANFNHQLNPKIIKERINHLKIVAENCAIEYRKQFLNKNIDVLIEGKSKEEPDFWEGHTDNYIKVRVKSRTSLYNQFVRLKLEKINKDYMSAAFYS